MKGYTLPQWILSDFKIKDVLELSSDKLKELTEELETLKEIVKNAEDKIKLGLEAKYHEQVSQKLRESAKDTGTVKFGDGKHTVVVTVPKKVEWDNDVLSALWREAHSNNADPVLKDIIKSKFSIDELRFLSLPKHLRNALEEARHVKKGKMVIKIEEYPTDV